MPAKATNPALKCFARLTKEAPSCPGDSPHIKVAVIWTGVALDRPSTFAWGLPDTTFGLNMAMRLVAAVNAGKAVTDPVIATDVNGKTYVKDQVNVWGKYMNKMLCDLGF